jgi:hypothetical protein
VFLTEETEMWPQIVIICLFVANFAINVVMHGKPRNANYSIWHSIFHIAIWATILNYGGFFNSLK